MLETLSIFTRGHSLAAGSIGRLAAAPYGFVLEVIIGFAYGTRRLPCLLSGIKRYVFGIAGEIAVGSMVLLALVGGVYGLGSSAEAGDRYKHNSHEQDSLHHTVRFCDSKVRNV